MCAFYDTSVAKSCREPVADEVRDKARANFCGYFQPISDAFRQTESAEADEAKAKLSALFGDSKSDRAANGLESEAEAARKKLEQMFGVDDKGKD